ncbi:hypothetical protein [Glaciecola sp. MH2013]|uniref:hypothetical protein n=1 Tax=Glaciecola sp. MH2013 TaxID=2785524 RepID=UPI00189DFED3|nr:hypothetical protein [Glaciecola sp. MH2013]
MPIKILMWIALIVLVVVLSLGSLIVYVTHYGAPIEHDITPTEHDKIPTKTVSRLGPSEVRFYGDITPENVDNALSLLKPGDTLVISSGGGNGVEALRLGKYIHANQISVEVKVLCLSSCANYIFLASPRKVLYSDALLVFHGGMKQKGLEEETIKKLRSKKLNSNTSDIDAASKEGKQATSYVRKAGALTPDECRFNHYSSGTSNNNLESFITACIGAMSDLETEFYNSIDCSYCHELPYHGQRGIYEKEWKSMKYEGFYYSIAKLKSYGMDVEVKGGEWAPKKNEYIEKFYEVF